MPRIRAALAFALLALGGGCSTSEAFQCQSDDQCVANGVDGICTDIFSCAYPDPECETGYKFPVSVGSLGGMCVPEQPGEASGTSTSTTTSTSASATDDTTTTAGSSGGGTTSAVCQDDGNDDFASATPLQPDGCSFSLEGTVDGDDDQDWFRIDDPTSFCSDDPADLTITVVGAGTCAYVLCSDSSLVSCVDASEDTLEAGTDLHGCCSTDEGSQFDLAAEVGCDPTELIVLQVDLSGAAECGSTWSTDVDVY